MADGQGCTCFAYYEGECACDADWTPQEVIDLRAEVESLRVERERLRTRLEWRDDGYDGIHCRDETIRVLESKNTALQQELAVFRSAKEVEQTRIDAELARLRKIAQASGRISQPITFV